MTYEKCSKYQNTTGAEQTVKGFSADKLQALKLLTKE